MDYNSGFQTTSGTHKTRPPGNDNNPGRFSQRAQHRTQLIVQIEPQYAQLRDQVVARISEIGQSIHWIFHLQCRDKKCFAFIPAEYLELERHVKRMQIKS